MPLALEGEVFTTGPPGKSLKYRTFKPWSGQWLRGDTPGPRKGAVVMLCWSSPEDIQEIPHVQGKRNPTKTVGTEKADQRADRLKPQSQKTSQYDHTDHSLI